MKFRPREDIRAKGRTFEIGNPESPNTYDSAKQGLDDATVERWYNAGWCEIEGRDPAPPRQVRRGVVVQAHNSRIAQKEKSHG